MRERRYLTFDMSNPRHVEALKLFLEQPDKMGSEFVINCILKAQQEHRMEVVIRQTIENALAGTLRVLTIPESPSEPQPTKSLADLPDVLIDSMNDF